MPPNQTKINRFLLTGTIFLIFSTTTTASAAGFDFGPWDRILSKRVKTTRIDGIYLQGFDYQGLRESQQSFLALLDKLSKFDPVKLNGLKEKLSFWINVYNIGAVKMVLAHPNIQSLNDIGPSKGAVWKMKAIEVGGRKYSLDNIEHEILRKMNEPRIHFAIVCASVSCPDIRDQAYHPEQLQQQLDDQVKKFLRNPDKGLQFVPELRELKITRLFKWFSMNFGSEQEVKKFIAQHLSMNQNQEIPQNWKEFRLVYLDYNWKLNRL